MASSPNGAQSVRHEPATQLVIPGAEPGSRLALDDITNMLRALLFVAPEPPTVDDLAVGTELDPADIERGLAHLERLETGLVLQRHGDRVSLATAPRYARQIRQFLGLDRETRLSTAALETLAIVAWRQPVTRSEVEAVRGVDCSGVIATLHAKSLIEPVSRRSTIGNPIQYGTTSEFLGHFGLGSLAELPALGQIDGKDGQDVLGAAMREPEPEKESDAPAGPSNTSSLADET